jgi:hypothetical protein
MKHGEPARSTKRPSAAAGDANTGAPTSLSPALAHSFGFALQPIAAPFSSIMRIVSPQTIGDAVTLALKTRSLQTALPLRGLMHSTKPWSVTQ